jgi:predicted RNA-binding Zn-ribbon protein involved in translation (DUF1610 family)
MKTCLNCDTPLAEEQRLGFIAHICPNCGRGYMFGIETNARYTQALMEREHQKLTTIK